MEGLGQRSGLSAASEGFVLLPRGGLCFPEHMAGDRGEASSFHVTGTTGHGEGTEQVAEARAQHGPLVRTFVASLGAVGEAEEMLGGWGEPTVRPGRRGQSVSSCLRAARNQSFQMNEGTGFYEASACARFWVRWSETELAQGCRRGAELAWGTRGWW